MKGIAGRFLHDPLENGAHYHAVFRYEHTPRTEKRARALVETLSRVLNNSEVSIELIPRYKENETGTGLGLILISPRKAKPVDEEKALEKALTLIDTYLKHRQDAN